MTATAVGDPAAEVSTITETMGVIPSDKPAFPNSAYNDIRTRRNHCAAVRSHVSDAAGKRQY
jgi:hypothetical protein